MSKYGLCHLDFNPLTATKQKLFDEFPSRAEHLRFKA